jgi:pyruvate,water dikinase
MAEYVLALEAVSEADFQLCGGKATGLGKLIRSGLAVPGGFCIRGDALSYLLDANSLNDEIAAIAADLNFDDYADVENKTTRIRSLITSATIPTDLEQELLESYRELVGADNRFVAVRSSVAVRGSEISSFPGMMDTYHYVLGEADVLEKIRECWASLWTARAAYARHQKNIPHHLGVMAPLVQLMIDSDIAGVLFTANPVTQDRSEIVIEANWGLGESVVSGTSMNDFYLLDKESLALKQKRVANKTVMVTLNNERGSGRSEHPVPADRISAAVLSDSQLVELGDAGNRIAQDFGFDADIEWAYEDDRLFILQARKIRGLQD